MEIYIASLLVGSLLNLGLTSSGNVTFVTQRLKGYGWYYKTFGAIFVICVTLTLSWVGVGIFINKHLNKQ